MLAVLCSAATWFLGWALPQAHAAGGCPPYEVIGARGSGEDKKPKERRDDLNMGPEVHDFYAKLRALIGGHNVKGYGVNYPAVDVPPYKLNFWGAALHIGFLGKYTDSVREGTRDAVGQINARHARCPDTSFILAGYSQGAQAIGKVLESKRLDPRIAAGVLFGDPYFNPESWSAQRGLPPASYGGFDPAGYGTLGVRGEWPEPLHGRVFSYCHYHDIVCNSSTRHEVGGVVAYVRNPAHMSISAHDTPAYRSTGVNPPGRGDADKAAEEVAHALGYASPPTPFTGPLDVAFVIDSTGSMFDDIEGVKQNVTELVQQIAAIDPDYRLALVDYKDSPDQESAYQARLDTDFTTDTASFEAALDGLEAEGGGDTPESVYSGLMTALGLEWRTGAKKVVVQIGDAPAKDPEPVTGYTLQDVQAKALSLDPAAIDTIQTGEDEETEASLSAIASSTAGQYLQLSEAELPGIASAIGSQVRRSTTAPVAVLALPSVAVSGQPATFSAASSSFGEPITAYEWDFDGDGTFDATTTDPVVSHTYPAPFTGSVVLRVRSADGLSGLASALFAVGAPPSGAPARPRNLRAALHRHKLILSWKAGKGQTAEWFTVSGRHRRALSRITPEAASRKGRHGGFSTTVAGLKPGHRYRFFVTAGNDAGESRPTKPVKVVLKRRSHRHRHQHRRHH